MTDACELAVSTGCAPPKVRVPPVIQGAAFAFWRQRAMQRWIARYGRLFEINVPVFGRSIVVSDPALVRLVCAAEPAMLANVEPNLGNWLGPGSLFALDGTPHRQHRRLISPALHGECLRNVATIVENETLREIALWPEGIEFRILEPMNRITLNVILGVLFGDEAEEFDELRAVVPPFMRRGQLLAFLPTPRHRGRRRSPWRRLDRLRAEFDRLAGSLISRAEADPVLERRSDLLAVLIRQRRSSGKPVTVQHLCDELLTLVCAGHETTAAALAWTVERLRRHPRVLAALVREADNGGGALRRATVLESLRVRTVIDVFGRRVVAPEFNLDKWRIPQGCNVLVRVADLHQDPENFHQPERFDPYRFLGAKPPASAFLPFGGGSRRCIGAEFAIAEIDLVLRTILRTVELRTDTAPDEDSRFCGVAHVPARGGRIVVRYRKRPPQ